MHIRQLVSILSSYWAIHPRIADTYLPLLASAINNQPLASHEDRIFQEERLKSRAYYVDLSTGERTMRLNELFTEGNAEEQDEMLRDNEFIMVMPIKGAIMKADGWCGEKGTESMMKELERASQIENVSGVVLDIDSGGGEVGGTEAFSREIKNFDKPIQAFVSDCACSAAFWIAGATDKITIASKTTEMGSIGTLISFMDARKRLKKAGVKMVSLYAAQSSKKNASFRSYMGEDGKDGDAGAAFIANELKAINDVFVNTMKENRGSLFNIDKYPHIYNGATYFGDDAIAAGLADGYGTLSSVVQGMIDKKETFIIN